MLSYVLFDRSNQYGIDRIALYSARYGQFTTWSLSDYMATLSGQNLDLAAERATVWELLGGRPGPLPAREGGSAAAAPLTPDDYYVDVLDAAESWYQLVEQVDEPTIEEWGVVVDALDSAVEALREFEAVAGTDVRDKPWGGTRAEVVAVIDGADAWYTANEADDLTDAELDAVFDRLGEAVQALRVAERRS